MANTYADAERTEVPWVSQAALFAVAGANLGVLGAGLVIVTTAHSPVALSVGPGIWAAAVIGGAIGFFLGINHKKKKQGS